MNLKHLATLEFPKVLERLAAYTAFSAGGALARAVKPSSDPEIVRRRLQETSEARRLFSVKPDVGLGGARDVRPQVENAARGATLQPGDLLDVRSTLISARNLRRTLTRLGDQFPYLSEIGATLSELPGVISEIARCINENSGEVEDHASAALGSVRRELRASFGRLQEKLQRILNNPGNATYLQEPIITQRNGRYVIPLKAGFKGRIEGVVHDQSSSGATLFIEPLATVELNNRWRELQIREEQEVHKVLLALSQLVGGEAHAIVQTVETLAVIDLIFARANYAEGLRAVEPKLVMPDAQANEPRLLLRQARHPLLAPDSVVPLDIDLDPQTNVVVITGPNTGGKTVTLKTIGLMMLMAQSGMHLPLGAGSALAVFSQVFADIGDEQSIEQSLSTFSSHMVNIKSILDQVDERSLVLLDEIGAGTDPIEGSALARALLEHLRTHGGLTFVATHYSDLKVWAHATPGVVNASMEFNAETLLPTYRLTIGLPGRSNAFAIATRLGLPADIVAQARTLVAGEALAAEDLLSDIHQQRDASARARQAIEAAQIDAEKTARELRERLRNIETERAKILDRTRAEAVQQLAALQAEIDALRQQLSAAQQADLDAAQKRAQQLEAQVAAQTETLQVEPVAWLEDAPRPPTRVGDTVWVRRLNTNAQVLSLGPREAEVALGALRMRVPRDELEWRASPVETHSTAERPINVKSTSTATMEIDLRGMRAEAALSEMEKSLDAAYLSGMPFVRVIHGKGTGALRAAVREALREHPLVRGFESGHEGEGGDGVTIVRLVLE